MPSCIRTSRQGTSLTVVMAGSLDHRLASSHFSRLLASSSETDELILDVSGVDSIRDSGLAALCLLRRRAHQAGKRLTVVMHEVPSESSLVA